MSELPDLNLKVGDKVEALGVAGVVDEIFTNSTYGVSVAFGVYGSRFMSDGKYLQWHKTPSLKVIERVNESKVPEKFQGEHPGSLSEKINEILDYLKAKENE